MRKVFPDGKGNAHMSIKGWDGNDKALSYLFHEETTDKEAELIVVKGMTHDRIEQFRTMNQEVQVKVKEAKLKSSHRLWENALEHFRTTPYTHYKDIAQFMVLDALRNDKYVPQAWLLKAMTWKVVFMLNDGRVRSEEQTAHLIVDEMWPNKKDF